MKKIKLDIEGMTCTACANAIEKNLSKSEGIEKSSVNFASEKMDVLYDENIIDVQQIIKKVDEIGYKAIDKVSDTDIKVEDNTIKHVRYMKKRLIYSLIFTIPLFYLSMGPMIGLGLPPFLSGKINSLALALTQLLLTIPVMIISQDFYKTGFKTLYKKLPTMDSLIAVGTSAAFIYSIFSIYMLVYGFSHNDNVIVSTYSHDLYFESAAVILALITLGKYLEAKAKGKTSEAIKKLMELTPETALVIRDNNELEIPIAEVVKGDIIIVKPGWRVPVDGTIVKGQTSIDESMLTGESIPVEKTEGATVIGGSINKSGYFQFKATKVGEETTLSQIVKLVEDAQSTKAPIAKLADKISLYFVPIVLAISLITFITWLLIGEEFVFALTTSISVLVISCPCALGLATPTAIMVGTGKGAENGILIKSGEALEAAYKADTIVFDKTGTITIGKPQVTDIIILDNSFNENQLIELTASIEKNSEHPLSEAIVEKAKEINITLREPKNFEVFIGKGIYGEVENKKILIGNSQLMQEKAIDITTVLPKTNTLADEGKTPLYVSVENKLIGVIAVADTLKENSIEAIDTLKKMNLEVIMLTGDNSRTANGIAKKLKIDKVISDVLPDQKSKEIKKLQDNKRNVIMVGDGINDAPALAQADISIAIGNGSDIAIESADIVLMKNDILDVPKAIKLSKGTIRTIKQNLFWAFFYNILGIPLAAGILYYSFGIKLNPMFAAAAMSFSSVTVVLNALRLKSLKLNINKVNKKDIQNGGKNMVKKLYIEGMSCQHCVGRVDKAIKEVNGVKSVEVSLETNTALVESFNDISDETLITKVEDAGYNVTKIDIVEN